MKYRELKRQIPRVDSIFEVADSCFDGNQVSQEGAQ